MNFIKDYMTNAGQVPKIGQQEVKYLFLAKFKKTEQRLLETAQ